MDKRLIKFGARCELARRRFFYFCRLKAPDFYRQDREYLVNICDKLEQFIFDDQRPVAILCVPPRHGKSRTIQLLVQWIFGKDKTRKIMTGSYNETLSRTFAKGVRDSISESKADACVPVYSDVFPDTKIERGNAKVNLWGLEGGYQNYLATSPTGTATGFGADLIIVDDLIKNAEEARNEAVKEKHWSWFTNTMLSRLEEDGKVIIVMTRWASDDLAGKAMEHYGDDAVVINYPAVLPDGSMLCPEILSHTGCEDKKRAMGADIWSANYQQEPIDLKGRLYSKFKTYKHDVPLFKGIYNYTDTADEGKDYLCSICFGVTFDNEAYVLDVLYTQEPMEITEGATADMLICNNVNVARIESNNGGRGFARSVTSILKGRGYNKTVIKTFHQSKNKVARILSNATWVMEHVYFPENWRDLWPDYYEAMYKYQREGKNKHDDAPDATTGIAESIASKLGGGMKVLK